MNYYGIILLIVVFSGVAVTLWGWKILVTSRKIGQWPTIEGRIVKSETNGRGDHLLPEIEFSYAVDNKPYTQRFDFPPDVDPMPELSASYVEKYPLGKKVTVYYNPENPSDATLETSLRGDWMILVLGMIVTVASLLAFFI